MSHSATAQATDELFIEIENSTALQMSATAAASGILAKHSVNVNIEALRDGSSIRHNKSINLNSRSKKNSINQNTGDGFLMQLPDGSIVTLVTTRLQSYVKGVETFTGKIKEIETGSFVLSIEKNKVYGQVNIEYMVYDIRYEKATKGHVLTEIDQARMPKHTPEPLSRGSEFEPASTEVNGVSLMSGGVNNTVRVLILHGSDVSNVTTLASNIISKMNDSFFDDEMDPDIHVNLADIRNLNNSLAGVCKETILDRMENDTAPFASIDTWVAAEDADVVLTIVTTDNDLTGCPDNLTFGRIGGQGSDLLNSSKPYAVTMDTYAIGDLTALHELGHLFGSHHPGENLTGWSNVEPYARGYISTSDDWQTIMGAYNTGCAFSTNLPNNACVRLSLWSDPTKSYSGEARGITYTSNTQSPLSADMRSALEVHMPIVAAFESYPYSAPATPGSIDHEVCGSQNVVHWTASTNAENYQVLQSFSSSFTNPEVIYFGDNLGILVRTYGSTVKYVKVRACNGSGCGSFSSQETLSYNGGTCY